MKLIRLDYESQIMIDLSVYVKYSAYTCSCVMGQCVKPEDVFGWLRNPDQLQKCLDKIDVLIDNID